MQTLKRMPHLLVHLTEYCSGMFWLQSTNTNTDRNTNANIDVNTDENIFKNTRQKYKYTLLSGWPLYGCLFSLPNNVTHTSKVWIQVNYIRSGTTYKMVALAAGTGLFNLMINVFTYLHINVFTVCICLYRKWTSYRQQIYNRASVGKYITEHLLALFRLLI